MRIIGGNKQVAFNESVYKDVETKVEKYLDIGLFDVVLYKTADLTLKGYLIPGGYKKKELSQSEAAKFDFAFFGREVPKALAAHVAREGGDAYADAYEASPIANLAGNEGPVRMFCTAYDEELKPLNQTVQVDFTAATATLTIKGITMPLSLRRGARKWVGIPAVAKVVTRSAPSVTAVVTKRSVNTVREAVVDKSEIPF